MKAFRRKLHPRIIERSSVSIDAVSRTGERMSARAAQEFERDVLWGLSQTPKTIPCKYFYDARGSRLFEEICETPEYYLTRTELLLLKRIGPEVAAQVGPHLNVLEPGSGAGEKIRILLDALESPRSFIPVDISQAALAASSAALARDYPDVEIHPVVADFARPVELGRHFSAACGENEPERRRLIFFPGSTISNFSPEEAVEFLAGLCQLVRPGGFLLIGVDRIKDKRILEQAYDDAQGVTGAFNLNLLERMGRELDTDLDPRTFRHRAVYNASLSRIEMHLDSRLDQDISISGQRISFREGESIHTENSYKYSVEGFQSLACQAGFRVLSTYSDDRQLFSVYLCTVL